MPYRALFLFPVCVNVPVCLLVCVERKSMVGEMARREYGGNKGDFGAVLRCVVKILDWGCTVLVIRYLMLFCCVEFFWGMR
jgi:hypothetical protein